MKISKIEYYGNHKRGISSIVGGVFFLVLMTSGFTVYYVALDSQSQMLNTQKIIADTQVGKIKEDFVVTASSNPVDNYRLTVNVVNTGNNPIEIADVWIVNKTDVGEPVKRYDNLHYRDVSIPVGHTANILANTALYLDDPETYEIKIVSTLGTVKKIDYDTSGGSNLLDAKLLAIPPDVRIGENATITLYVTNRGIETITQVEPDPLTVSPDRCGALLDPVVVAPIDLKPSQSTVFIWHCTLFGALNEDVEFSTTARGMLGASSVPSNTASDVVTIREDQFGGGQIILNEELLGRPEIFMIIPSPFGNDDNAERGLWGVNVVNPTPFPMNVSKVTISVFTPRAQSQDTIFLTQTCNFSSYFPTLNTEWSCPIHNQLMWKNTTNPTTIDAYSMSPFMLALEPGELGGSQEDLETVPVQASVFTTLGQFGKTGYGTAMDNTHSGIPNVFLTTTPVTPTSNIYVTKTGMTAGQTETFHAVLADFESGATNRYEIDPGAKLIINAPKDWAVSNPSSSTFTISTRTIATQTQVIGTLNNALQSGGAVMSFDMTPPCVPNTQMFIMYILADGNIDTIPTSSYKFPIGPLAEIVLQVNPDLIGCPPP